LDLIKQGGFKLKKTPPPDQTKKAAAEDDPNDMASILAKIAEARALIENSSSSSDVSESSESDF
jgi:hypothetical protein